MWWRIAITGAVMSHGRRGLAPPRAGGALSADASATARTSGSSMSAEERAHLRRAATSPPAGCLRRARRRWRGRAAATEPTSRRWMHAAGIGLDSRAARASCAAVRALSTSGTGRNCTPPRSLPVATASLGALRQTVLDAAPAGRLVGYGGLCYLPTTPHAGEGHVDVPPRPITVPLSQQVEEARLPASTTASGVASRYATALFELAAGARWPGAGGRRSRRRCSRRSAESDDLAPADRKPGRQPRGACAGRRRRWPSGSGLRDTVRSFLGVLAQPAAARRPCRRSSTSSQRLLAAHRGEETAEVTSAVPLDEPQLGSVRDAVAALCRAAGAAHRRGRPGAARRAGRAHRLAHGRRIAQDQTAESRAVHERGYADGYPRRRDLRRPQGADRELRRRGRDGRGRPRAVGR